MTAMQRLDAAMACLDALRDAILAGIPDPPAAQQQHEALGWLLLGIHEDATVEHGAPVSEGPAPIPPGAGPTRMDWQERTTIEVGPRARAAMNCEHLAGPNLSAAGAPDYRWAEK